MNIRTVEPGDLTAVRDVHVRAFDGRPDEARLVGLLHAAKKAQPSLVAIYNDKAVAHIVFSMMTLDPPRTGFSVAGLGPVAVLPEYQRSGIGTQLIRAGIAACKNMDIDAIAVLGGPAFYSRFGFQPAMRRGFTNEYVTDEHFMILELRHGALAEAEGLLKYAPEFRAAGC